MRHPGTDALYDLAAAIQGQVLDEDRVAIQAPGRDDLSYAQLWSTTSGLAALLAARGLRRGDAVAAVLPDGPEQLTTMLAVSQAAVCAPLNPAFTEPEFAFFLADLRARALIVQAGDFPAAEAAAHGLGIQVLAVRPGAGAPAGVLDFAGLGELAADGPPEYPIETALLLHTSATTGQPKLVPLTHRQLIDMVIVLGHASPGYQPGRCLMLTPQFHLHAILAMVAELIIGGVIICTGGFRPEHLAPWLRTYRPTHYTGTPALHRAVLAVAQAGDLSSLRFVTSLGAALPEALQAELESRIGAPVIDGYGLTEAGRVTQTPRDPGLRKPGSVGLCVGPEVAILDGRSFKGPGRAGEILLKGATVITGYAHNPEANREAFLDGWFRTGDLGFLDADGHLFITGRLKEMINRGGEKILPYEVETVLSRHPAVLEAAVFAFPHPRLGEDIAAAVVARPGSAMDALGLRRFAAESLAAFKVPRRILFLAEIPRSRTGKYQRATLAATLGVAGPERSLPGEWLDPQEALLAGIWCRLLDVPALSESDDFFALGGDSTLALSMLLEAEAVCGRPLGTGLLAESGAFGDFLAAIRAPGGPPGVVALKTGGPGEPVFLVHGLLGFRGLAQLLGGRGPVYALDNKWVQGDRVPPSLEALAGEYLDDLCAFRPRGPYLLGGYSVGGLIAFAMARLLVARGETVTAVLLLDTRCISWLPRPGRLNFWFRARLLARQMDRKLRAFRDQALGRWSEKSRARHAARCASTPFARAIGRLAFDYRPPPLPVPVLLLCCRRAGPGRRRQLQRQWATRAVGRLVVREIPGQHETILGEPHAAQVAAEILDFLHQVRPDAGVVPSRALAGTAVRLQGSGFGGTTRVLFGRLPAEPSRVTDGEIEVVVPPGAKTDHIHLAGSGGATVDTGAVFTVLPGTITLSRIEPERAQIGEEITIRGTRLEDVTEVWFGAIQAEAFTVAEDGGSIRVAVPPRATSGEVSIRTQGGPARVAPTRLTILQANPPAPAPGPAWTSTASSPSP